MTKLYILTLLVAISSVLHAQKKWSLQECIEYGWEHNANILQSRLTMEESDVAISQASQARFPSLSGSVGVNTNFGRTIDPVSNQFSTKAIVSNGINLNSGVLLYNAGRLKNALRQARLQKERSATDIDKAKEDLALKIAQDYMNVLLASDNIDILQSQYELTQQQYKNLEKSVSIGTKARYELANIEAELARSEQNIIAGQNQLDIAKLTLKQDMQYDMNKDIDLEIPDVMLPIDDPEKVDVQNVYTQALRNQKGILSAQQALDVSEYGIKIAKSGYYPSVHLSGNAGTNYSNQSRTITSTKLETVEQVAFVNEQPVKLGLIQPTASYGNKSYVSQLTDNLSYGLGVNVSIPIYDNGNTSASIQRAKINKKRAALNLEQSQNQLYMSVKRAVNDARSAKKKYVAAQKSVDAAKAVYETTNKRFEVGGIGSYQLIDAQNRYEQSRINLTIAKYEYILAGKVLDFYGGKQIF